MPVPRTSPAAAPPSSSSHSPSQSSRDQPAPSPYRRCLRCFWSLPLLAVTLLAGTGCNRGEESAPAPTGSVTAQRFGAPLSGQSPREELSRVLATPDAYVGKSITVEGKVLRACQAKGCWMELAPPSGPGTACRVTFKDYGFFVPLDAAGAQATLEGTVRVKKVPATRVHHLEAEGATFPKKNPDGTADEIQFVATGVELVR